MKIACALLLCLTGLYGQDPKAAQGESTDQAPPPVAEALRTRVSQFYQAYIDGKWRSAEQVVAEDSEDAFLGADKQRIQSFEIVKARYSDDFTRAQVVTNVHGTFTFHGRRVPVTMPLTTFWKVVDGQWFWYTLPPDTKRKVTPFGVMQSTTGEASSTPGFPPDPTALAQSIRTSVKVDKMDVRLSSYQPASEEVTITNGLRGRVTLRADTSGGLRGFTVKLEKTELGPGEKCKLLLSMDPKDDKTAKPTLTVRVWIEPLEEMIPIKVTFAIPPEVERLIPK